MDTAQCIWTSCHAEGKNITIDNYKGLYLIREQNVERIFSDNTSINRFVISEAILKRLQLISDSYGKDSILCTDGFYVTEPKVTYPNKKDVKFKVKNIDNAYVTDSNPTYFEKHYRENMDTNDYKTQTGTGCIYYGEAGCVKTTKLCKMVLTAQNPIVLSFTNKAVENVKESLKGICDKEGIGDLSDICHTFDSYFCDYHGRDIPDLDAKTILIVEYSMVLNKWMTKIYQAFSKYCNTIYMFGDVNQCDPVEGHSQVHYDYHTSKTIMEMCPNRVKLEYIEGCSRYDRQTRDINQINQIPKQRKSTGLNFLLLVRNYNNICYLNKTRKIVTKTCCNEFKKLTKLVANRPSQEGAPIFSIRPHSKFPPHSPSTSCEGFIFSFFCFFLPTITSDLLG